MTDSNVRKMIKRAGENAEIGFPVHLHMLRHSAGYKLANDGQDTGAIQHYMGHKNIQHTVRYTELTPARFKDFWKDQRRLPRISDRNVKGFLNHQISRCVPIAVS
jgi:site-specific recombinase XerD